MWPKNSTAVYCTEHSPKYIGRDLFNGSSYKNQTFLVLQHWNVTFRFDDCWLFVLRFFQGNTTIFPETQEKCFRSASPWWIFFGDGPKSSFMRKISEVSHILISLKSGEEISRYLMKTVQLLQPSWKLARPTHSTYGGYTRVCCRKSWHPPPPPLPSKPSSSKASGVYTPYFPGFQFCTSFWGKAACAS